MQDDLKNIEEAYANRLTNDKIVKKHQGTYPVFIKEEREQRYRSILRRIFAKPEILDLLEVGAGQGGNLEFFHDLGIPYSKMYANELLTERVIELKKLFPEITVIGGSATEIKTEQKFDIVFQSTVFTSILNNEIRRLLAEKMWELLKQDGIVLWYDFVYDNPNNIDVKKVSVNEIRTLFPNAKKFEFYKVTLAPPIGRRVGKWYSFFNRFSFLRTHTIAVIHK